MRNIGMSANRAGPGRNSAGFRGTVVSTTQSIKWRKPSFLGQDSLDERDSEPLGEDDNVDIDNDVFEVMYRETFRDIKVTSRTPSRNGSTARCAARSILCYLQLLPPVPRCLPASPPRDSSSTYTDGSTAKEASGSAAEKEGQAHCGRDSSYPKYLGETQGDRGNF